MGSSASKVAGYGPAGAYMVGGVAAAVQTISAATAAFSAAAAMASVVFPPLALGLTAAAVSGAAAGWSYDQTPASAGSGGTSASPWSTGFAAAKKAARDAIHGVFEAIAKAQEAASSYVYALSSAASWIAAKAYDKVERAAANVKRRVVALIERLYGTEAAVLGKTKLESVDGPIGAGDASSLVESTVDGISGGGATSAIVPVSSSGPLVVHLKESPAARLARSSAVEMMSLLDSIPSLEKKVGLKIPVVAKVAIGVIAVAAGLCLSVCSPTMLATASVAAAAFL